MSQDQGGEWDKKMQFEKDEKRCFVSWTCFARCSFRMLERSCIGTKLIKWGVSRCFVWGLECVLETLSESTCLPYSKVSGKAFEDLANWWKYDFEAFERFSQFLTYLFADFLNLGFSKSWAFSIWMFYKSFSAHIRIHYNNEASQLGKPAYEARLK